MTYYIVHKLEFLRHVPRSMKVFVVKKQLKYQNRHQGVFTSFKEKENKEILNVS